MSVPSRPCFLSCLLLFPFLILMSLPCGSGILLKVISIVEDETVFETSCKWDKQLLRIKSPDGLEGLLIPSVPEDACTKPIPPKGMNTTYPIDPDWVLIASWKKKDRCTLMTKVTMADDAGYSGIVIGFEEEEEISSIVTDDSDYGLSIFPCLVNMGVSHVLKNNYTNENYKVLFQDETIDTWTRFFITTFLALIAILMAIALSYCVVQMFILLVIWVRNTVVHAIEQRRINRRRRLPYRQLKRIPIQAWTAEMGEETCTICLENFEESEKVRILPCNHSFHQVCIDPWLLKQRRKCPNCKRKIVFPDEPYASDSSTEDDRAPLIRREGSLDYSIAGGLTFTFNESDFANQPEPIYRAIHRMMRDANARHRALQEQRLRAHASSSRPGTSTSSDSSSSSPDSALRTAIVQNRVSRFCPRRKLPRSLFRSSGGEYLEDTSREQAVNPSDGNDSFLEEGNRAYEASVRQVQVEVENGYGIVNGGCDVNLDVRNQNQIVGDVSEISEEEELPSGHGHGS